MLNAPGLIGTFGEVVLDAPSAPPAGDWILAAGAWDDTGVWDDAAIWID
jgi:hypothetical protein